MGATRDLLWLFLLNAALLDAISPNLHKKYSSREGRKKGVLFHYAGSIHGTQDSLINPLQRLEDTLKLNNMRLSY